MANDFNVGRANIAFTGDGSGASDVIDHLTDLFRQELIPALQESGKRGADARKRMDLPGWTQDLGDASRGVKKFITSFTGIASTAFFVAGFLEQMIQAGKAVVQFKEDMFDGEVAAANFIKTLEGGPDAAAKNVSELRNKIAEVAAELARADEAGSWLFRGGRLRSTIKEDLADLRKAERSATQQAEAYRKSTEKAEKAKRQEASDVSEIEDMLASAREEEAAALTPEQRVQQEFEARMERLSDLRKRVTDKARLAELDLVEKVWRRTRERRMREERERSKSSSRVGLAEAADALEGAGSMKSPGARFLQGDPGVVRLFRSMERAMSAMARQGTVRLTE
jgi:flagellar biosynthesis GTPase FlhF